MEIEPPIVQGRRDPARWQVADEEQSEEVQRWTAKRRAALAISVLRGETTAAEAARRHGLKVAEVEEWRERCLLGAENALRARPKEEDALLNRLKRKVAERIQQLIERHPTFGYRRLWALLHFAQDYRVPRRRMGCYGLTLGSGFARVQKIPQRRNHSAAAKPAAATSSSTR
jgi:hypothetical protein